MNRWAFPLAAATFLALGFLAPANALTVVGMIAAYVVAGALYARSQYVRLWRETREANIRSYGDSHLDLIEKWTRRETPLKVAVRVPFWPYALLYDAVRGPLGRWLSAPLVERQEYAAQLRADADQWARVVTTTDSDSEREMATELMRICLERADEVTP